MLHSKHYVHLFAWLVLAPGVFAQADVENGDRVHEPTPAAQRLEEFIRNEDSGFGGNGTATAIAMDPIGTFARDPLALDSSTKLAYQKALQEYYNYRADGYKHRRRVFDWQFLSSKIIFYAVIFLVLAGLYFSWVQFQISMRLYEKWPAQGPATTTQLTASTSGLEVSSPVLGVIILVVSLAFFYLYLKFVYPINEIL